ncbi:TPA: hypothetical protein I7133_24395, partial [Vibrio vulnificus]|nr:hypothetical protein [Vibrio vulnificus]
FHVVSTMISIYPWQRRGLNGPLPQLSLQDILTFPFTLEQLEDSHRTKTKGKKKHGKAAE